MTDHQQDEENPAAANDSSTKRRRLRSNRSKANAVGRNRVFQRAAIAVRWCVGAICLTALASALYIVFIANRLPPTTNGASGTGATSIGATDVGIIAFLLAILLLLICPWKRLAALQVRLFALSFGLSVAFVILELFARVSTPFPIAVQGGRINLPFHLKKEHRVEGVEGLDELVTVSFNSLGFRGPEPPEDWDSALTILCVGGSTTECTYLSDEKTWPDRLSKKLSAEIDGVWLNNAGIDGHSTFGHLQLLDQYISTIRPKVVLLYVGINDVGRTDLNRYDEQSLRTKNHSGDSLAKRIHRRFIRHSDLLALADNLRRQRMAKSLGLTHQVEFGHKSLEHIKHVEFSDEHRAKLLREHDQQCLVGYRKRLEELVKKCHAIDIKVVLITQPALYGVGVDNSRAIDLETVRVGQVDGWTQWKLLQMYNHVTTDVGSQLDVPVIGLAETIPKSSRYYYDLLHYTNDGAELLATKLHRDLMPILGDWYPELILAGAGEKPQSGD
jgi:hypothetical protein